MAKIDISKVAEILKKNALEPAMLRRIIEEMNLIAQPETGGEGETAKIHKQFVILLSDPDHRMPKHDFVGWIAQIPDNDSPVTIVERIVESAWDYNASKRGRLLPVKTVGEAIENVPAKFFRERDTFVKTRTPVLVIHTDNSIPKDSTQGIE